MRVFGTALWIVVASLACHHHTKDEGDKTPATDANTPVLVEIENHFQGDVVIYLMRANQRERLGMVTALGGTSFTFPYRRLGTSGSSRLLAYPIAGASAWASDPLYIQPGQSLKWTLEAELSRSSLVSY
jgi:hypothetical protein